MEKLAQLEGACNKSTSGKSGHSDRIPKDTLGDALLMEKLARLEGACNKSTSGKSGHSDRIPKDTLSDALLMEKLARLEGLSSTTKPSSSKKSKIFICSRTIKQIDQLIDALKSLQPSIQISILASRKQLCINKEVRAAVDINDACHKTLKKKGCKYFGKNEKSTEMFQESVFNIEDAYRNGKCFGECPYYTTRSMLTTADVVFAPYNYLIDPFIRNGLSVDLTNAIVIVDEAHNIEDFCRSAGSLSLSGFELRRYLDAIKKCFIVGYLEDDVAADLACIRGLFELLGQIGSSNQHERAGFGGNAHNNPTNSGPGSKKDGMSHNNPTDSRGGLNMSNNGRSGPGMSHNNPTDSRGGLNMSNNGRSGPGMSRNNPTDSRGGLNMSKNGRSGPGMSHNNPTDSRGGLNMSNNGISDSTFRWGVSSNSVTDNLTGLNSKRPCLSGAFKNFKPIQAEIPKIGTLKDLGALNKQQSTNYPIKSTASTEQKHVYKGADIQNFLNKIGVTTDHVFGYKSAFKNLNTPQNTDLLPKAVLNNTELLIYILETIIVEKTTSYCMSFAKTTDSFRIDFYLLDAALIFKPLSSLCKSIILLSGTLKPFYFVENELGHRFNHCLEASHSITKSNLLIKIIQKGSDGKDLIGKYGAESRVYMKEVVSHISCLRKHLVCGGMLVFVPSYSFLEMLEKVVVDEFVFFENKMTKKFEKAFLEYKKGVKSNGRPVFVCVYRGRASEGIDFKDDYARMVVAVGIPYPSYTDCEILAKREYNDRFKKMNGKTWYEAQAFRAVNQAIGRVVRHSEDWGAVIFLDSRYAWTKNLGSMSRWVKDNVGVCKDLKELTPQLSEFMRSKAPHKNS